MKNIIQLWVSQEDGVYTASGVNVPVVTDGKTFEELAKNIQEATELCLEGEDPASFGLAPSPSVLLNFELPRSFTV